MPERAAASLTRHRSFVLFWCARTFTDGAYMMQGVAVGWQIYELTNDPFDLGLVGLVQFVPLVVLSVVIGQVADRFDRRIVVATCQIGKALAALALAVGTARGSLTRDAMLAILLVSGTARAFEMPSIHALLPGIVPVTLLPRAISCRPGRGRSAYCARRRRSGRWPFRSFSRAAPSPATPAALCTPRSESSGWRAWLSDCRPRSRCHSSRS